MALSLRVRALSIVPLAALALLAGGGALLAQMESGDRGILPIDSSGTLEVGGISVDVGGKDADSARFAGWRLAQRKGFAKLWAKAHGRPESEAPVPADSLLDNLVSAVVVEKEQVGPTRYVATLGLQFDRTRAGELLGMGGEMRRSPPMLLIPVTVTGGTMTSVELKNPWQRAWAQFRTTQSPIDYVRVSGLGADPLLVNAAQTARPGRGWWRNITDFYGAANVLVAQVQLHRLYPGGPATARFVAKAGADGRVLGSFTLHAKDSDDIARMMAEGVEKVDALYAAAFAAGKLGRDASLIILPPPPPVEEVVEAPQEVLVPPQSYSVMVYANDAASLVSAIGELRAVPGVTAVSEEGGAPGGASKLSVSYRGEAAALRAAMTRRGWGSDFYNGMLRLTRPGTAVAAPKPPAEAPSP